jgi:hypothetical protein
MAASIHTTRLDEAMTVRSILISAPLVPPILADRKTMTRRGPEWAERVKPGDLLYVCETHYRFGYWVPDGTTKTGKVKWRFVGADDTALFRPPPQFRVSRDKENPGLPQWYCRLGRFMFARHARIHLRVTGVKVERLQDISEADAIAEGVFEAGEDVANYGPKAGRIAFRMLWNSLHGPAAWDENPEVCAISFERMKP